MKFPSIGDIATTAVVSIDIHSTFDETMSKMLHHEHRNIIVTDTNDFYIMSIIDILNVQDKDIGGDSTLCDLHLSKIPIINKDKNILNSLEFLNNSTEYIAVVNDDGSLYGLVTHTDITSNIDPDTLMDNYRLQDLLKLGRRMKWVNRDEKISHLLKDMVNNFYDNVVVVEDLKPIGIFTTKDIMRLIKNKTDLDVEINQHMSSPVDSIHKNSSIREALSFIKEKHYKRVIVVDDNGLLSGIITQKELISLSYSKWAILMKEYQDELSEINVMLQNKNIEYENIASTDSLTGLYNRHKFSQLYLSSYTSMVQRHNDMSLILLDIDYFKKVNDVYGHNAGDKTLVQVSHTILKILRNVDVVCRWGGEEFLIILPTADIEHAISIAEKLRKAIEDLCIDVVGKITASFGVSQVREGEEMQESIDRADKALYLAKDSGRNCVKCEADI
ncbi:MAG: diguanylate cyclase [Sulfurimonas sp.]|jgi:diguanylate cyclase (GGDEF)-like protein|nr:diguanylate cyclase [Sulfurimonas sp.]